ncbi:MAG: inositol monophosphatase [Firmicutes bacterium]|nr:inositol monophosphatase [Bacillota bacterium]
MIDLREASKNVKSWAKKVGKMQKDNLTKANLLINKKSTDVDLVTEVDELSEEYIIKAIKSTYPEHGILSEEAGKKNCKSDYLWIVDPLDGTTNYAQGLPIFAISIALKYKEDYVLGVIYIPMLDELFEAIKGKGAYLNGKSITVSSKDKLNQCVLATGFPYDRAINKDNNANYFAHFVPKVRGLRRMGVAAFDLANVACGRLDGFWEINLSLWDVAAGILIIKEANGYVKYLENKRGVSLVAGNENICKNIVKEIRKVD